MPISLGPARGLAPIPEPRLPIEAITRSTALAQSRIEKAEEILTGARTVASAIDHLDIDRPAVEKMSEMYLSEIDTMAEGPLYGQLSNVKALARQMGRDIQPYNRRSEYFKNITDELKDMGYTGEPLYEIQQYYKDQFPEEVSGVHPLPSDVTPFSKYSNLNTPAQQAAARIEPEKYAFIKENFTQEGLSQVFGDDAVNSLIRKLNLLPSEVPGYFTRVGVNEVLPHLVEEVVRLELENNPETRSRINDMVRLSQFNDPELATRLNQFKEDANQIILDSNLSEEERKKEMAEIDSISIAEFARREITDPVIQQAILTNARTNVDVSYLSDQLGNWASKKGLGVGMGGSRDTTGVRGEPPFIPTQGRSENVLVSEDTISGLQKRKARNLREDKTNDVDPDVTAAREATIDFRARVLIDDYFDEESPEWITMRDKWSKIYTEDEIRGWAEDSVLMHTASQRGQLEQFGATPGAIQFSALSKKLGTVDEDTVPDAPDDIKDDIELLAEDLNKFSHERLVETPPLLIIESSSEATEANYQLNNIEGSVPKIYAHLIDEDLLLPNGDRFKWKEGDASKLREQMELIMPRARIRSIEESNTFSGPTKFNIEWDVLDSKGNPDRSKPEQHMLIELPKATTLKMLHAIKLEKDDDAQALVDIIGRVEQDDIQVNTIYEQDGEATPMKRRGDYISYSTAQDGLVMIRENQNTRYVVTPDKAFDIIDKLGPTQKARDFSAYVGKTILINNELENRKKKRGVKPKQVRVTQEDIVDYLEYRKTGDLSSFRNYRKEEVDSIITRLRRIWDRPLTVTHPGDAKVIFDDIHYSENAR